MAVNKVIIKVPSQDAQYVVNGDWSVSQIQNMYAAQIPGLQAMHGTATEESTPEGAVRTITFAPRSGNKGARSRQ